MDKFPVIDISGNNYELGFQHGELLANRIKKSIEFYIDVTETLDEKARKENAEKVLALGRRFKEIITNFNRDYSVEIEAIAEGAKVDPLWIYAINARTEIMTTLKVNDVSECTALYYRQNKLLGQNWDWASEFENLAVLMKMNFPNGHQILQMTEPGIIGKIGLNNKGLGVGLNFLTLKQVLFGVPVHIILRTVLDSDSIEEAMNKISGHEYGKASNIILADNQGNYEDIEFAGDNIHKLNNENDILLHTNHYLGNAKLNEIPDDLRSSLARYSMASSLIQESQDQSIQGMKAILKDQSNSELPICRNYAKGSIMREVGTVCSVIMDLRKSQLHVTRGHPLHNDYVTLGF